MFDTLTKVDQDLNDLCQGQKRCLSKQLQTLDVAKTTGTYAKKEGMMWGLGNQNMDIMLYHINLAQW